MPSRGRSVRVPTPPPVGFLSPSDALIAEPLESVKSGDSISVTVRFRPLSEREIQRGDEVACYADGDKIVHNEYNPTTAYAFDKVFGPSTNLKDVYDVAVRPVVKTAMEGVNDVRFTSVGKGTFFIRATTEEDIDLITKPGKWFVAERQLVANRWEPGMLMKIDGLNRVCLWIRLPDLPSDLWIPRVFQAVAEAIGAVFVEADEYTQNLQRYGFARLRIEVPLGFQSVSEIEL